MKRAMVLAAWKGLRLRPLTDRIPKPMVEVGGMTMIDRQLDLLVAAGIEEAVVNTSYLSDILEAHLSQRRLPRLHISREEELLETGGGIVKALPLLGDDPFYSANSDVILVNGPGKPALSRLTEHWDSARMDALLLLIPTGQATGYTGEGDFSLEPDGSLCRRQEGEHAPYVFTGVQIMHPRLFENSPEGAFSLNVLYNRKIELSGRLPNIHGLVHDGQWLHVGDSEGLRRAEAALAAA